MWWTKSVTLTESVMSWVSVPSQRSATVHLVPSTVAALYLPLVLNLPLALACSSWSVRDEAFADAGVAGLVLGAQRVGRRALERALDNRERDEALAGASGCLADLEDRATEVALLGDGFALLTLLALALRGHVGGRMGAAGNRRDQREGSVDRVDLGVLRDLRQLGQRDELAVDLDQDEAADRGHVERLAERRRAGRRPWLVVNVMSGPNVVPLPLVATRRT